MSTEADQTQGDVGGQRVVLAYGSVSAEYDALHSACAIFDRSHRGRVRVRGSKAAEMVAGLVTNDVIGLTPGQGCYAAALSAKGKIVADLRVLVQEDSVLTDVPPRATEAWVAMVKKYINPRVAPYADESASTRDIGVYGPNARHVVAAITGIPATALSALAPYAHATVEIGGMPVLVLRAPDLGSVDGYELVMAGDLFPALWQGATDAGAVPAGLEAWEVARVEAGRPEWGIDMDDSTIPQEANFDELHAISYTKGCYVGQETVARVHFRGHVNRHLRGIRAAGMEPPPSGATLHAADGVGGGAPVGDVRSAVRSPRLGGIALAMVRREVEPDAVLVARWGGGDGDTEGDVAQERKVDLAMLPFPA